MSNQCQSSKSEEFRHLTFELLHLTLISPSFILPDLLQLEIVYDDLKAVIT
jgi:hypothetical protein